MVTTVQRPWYILWAVVCFSGLILRAQPTVWDGVYTDSQADAGAELYDEHCSRCHGDIFEAADAAPPLSGPEFRANWQGLTLKDLFERIRVMPSFKTSSRDRVTNANILAFLLRINGFPSGEVQLPDRAELLARIKIVANKPR